MRIISIDPGYKGSVCLLSPDEVLYEKLPYEKVGEKKYVNVRELRDYFLAWAPDLIVIEKQFPIHKQGLVSSFTTAFNFGILYGAARSTGVNVEIVNAKEYKKHHGITGDKKQSVRLARILFPCISIKDSDDGISDALLLAEYVRQAYRG